MGKITTYIQCNCAAVTMLLLLFCTTLLSAQNISTEELTQAEKEAMQIYPGFIVTANHNDTIFGEVQFFNPTFNEITLIFYKDGERTQYYPAGGEIAEYAFQYKKYNKAKESLEPYWFVYVRKLVPESPIKGGAKEVFMERQVYGNITLYNYYTLKTSKINSRRYKHNYFIEKSGIGGFTLKTIDRDNYREMIREHLVLGNDELEENLGTSGFGYKYLADLVNIQNAWLENSPEYYILLRKAQGKIRHADIPVSNMDLERDKEKIKTTGRVVVPSGDMETESKKTEEDKKKSTDID